MIKVNLYGSSETTEMYTIRDFLKRSLAQYNLIDEDKGAGKTSRSSLRKWRAAF